MLWRAFALLAHGGDRLGLRPSRAGRAPAPLRHPDRVLRLLERLDEAAWTANALSAAAESGLLANLAQPATAADLAAGAGLPEAAAAALLDVMAGLGLVTRDGAAFVAAPGLKPFTQKAGADAFRAALRASLLQGEDFRRQVRRGTLALDGWRFEDADVIEAQGALTGLFAERAIPKLRFLPGLVPRLEAPGAALLDVGAGAAGLSIALCRHFPNLAAVALEPAPHPAAAGERLIREAGLAARIALRRERVEDIADASAYDLAFLPQMFLPDAIIAASAATLFRALRPGGWLLAATLARPGGDLSAALSRLKTLLWGGNRRGGEELRRHLAAAGFSPVIRAPGSGQIRVVCARKPE